MILLAFVVMPFAYFWFEEDSDTMTTKQRVSVLGQAVLVLICLSCSWLLLRCASNRQPVRWPVGFSRVQLQINLVYGWLSHQNNNASPHFSFFSSSVPPSNTQWVSCSCSPCFWRWGWSWSQTGPMTSQSGSATWRRVLDVSLDLKNNMHAPHAHTHTHSLFI